MEAFLMVPENPVDILRSNNPTEFKMNRRSSYVCGVVIALSGPLAAIDNSETGVFSTSVESWGEESFAGSNEVFFCYVPHKNL